MKLGLYEHYSGKQYLVFGIARHSETLEEMVVYQQLYGDFRLWVRPKVMFEAVIDEKENRARFTYKGPILQQPPTLR